MAVAAVVLTAWTALAASMATLAGSIEVTIVQAPDSPVKLATATVLSTTDAPPVLLYSATNPSADAVDEFTVMVYVFRQGTLKARQVAPGRRTLDAHETK